MSTHDVIVIVAGLTAAWRPTQAGADVVVLEARDRVGGRLRRETRGDASFEIGGRGSPPTDRARPMVDELGLTAFPRCREGESLFIDRAGTPHRFADKAPLAAGTDEEIERVTKTQDGLAAEMDPDRP